MACSGLTRGPMEVLKTTLAGVPLLRVAGDIDHSSAPALDEAVSAALSDEGRRLLFDLTDCPYIDSGGLAVLLRAVKQVGDRGWVGVVGSNVNVLRLFEIVGLTKDAGFRVFPDSASASGAIAEAGC
jgi:anti-sigma B factor antagonist